MIYFIRKRPILFGFIGGILLLFVIYFSFLKQPKDIDLDDIDTILAVPINSELVVHIPHLEEFLKHLYEEDGISKEFGYLETIKELKESLEDVKNVLSTKDLVGLLDDSQLTLCTKIIGRKEISLSYIFPLRNSSNKKLINKLIRSFSKDYTNHHRRYSGFSLHELRHKRDELSWYYAFAKGLFIFSSAQIPVEDALLQINSGNSLLDDKSFQKLKKIASSNDDLNIFINGKTFPKLLSFGLNSKYRQFVKELTDFTTRPGIDLTINKKSMLLNGFMYTDKDDFYYTNILLNQSPVVSTMEEIIPSNTGFWASLSLSNEHAYLDNYKRYLEQTGDIRAYRKFAKRVKSQTGFFPEDIIYPLLDSEIGLVVSQGHVLGETAERYCVVKTKSKSETEAKLQTFLKNYAKKTKSRYISKNYRISNQLSYRIYSFPFSDFANMLWGGLFYETESKFCTLIDNYLVFGKDFKSLRRYIDFITRGKTLKYEEFYQKQREYHVDNKSTFNVYVRAQSVDFFKEFVSDYLKAQIDDKVESLVKLSAIGLQIKTLKDMLYVNGYAFFEDKVDAVAETVWQSRLQHSLRMKPVMVKNHKTKEQELIIQDDNNVLYLVSNSGHILWKRNLEDSILGGIHQVDCYKNNKLQYLFNTPNRLYLVDRNGNDVAKFPIKLPSKATNGISVFDYDKNRSYRIFFACDNKRTYLYSIEGEQIDGWKPKKNEHIVKGEVQHFMNAGKDYITYHDGYRNYILTRRGSVRVIPKKNFKKALYSPVCITRQTKYQPCQLIATDTIGTIFFTKLDGSITTKKVGKFSANHRFMSEDINSDGRNDFIFLDGSKMMVFDASGKELFDYDFHTEVLSDINIYSFASNNKKIGVTANGLCYLFNSNGKLYDGFPIEGYSEFSIGFVNSKQRQFNLFVAGVNDLFYNYRVK